jgi:hypothetical protein
MRVTAPQTPTGSPHPAPSAEQSRGVAEGRYEPVDGWWVDPDRNLPSGESFALLEPPHRA